MHNSSHDEELSLRPDGFAMDSFAMVSAPNAAQHANGQHAADESAASGLLLTLPGSPTLLPLTASPSPPPSGLDAVMSKQQYQQHVQQQQAQQQQAQQQQQLKQQMNAAMDDHGVQSYFQTDGDNSLSHEATSFSREFNELQQSVTGLEDRRFAEELVDKLTDAPTASAGDLNGAQIKTKPLSKKRKAGANVSIDLQTKIRLIELAEEYQYDPKYSGRGKQDGTPIATPAKDQMSGIRLAQQFGLNKSTVSRILKRKEEFKKAYYKDNLSGGSKHINKKSKFEKLNRLVENWFDVTREKKVAVSDTLIRDVGKRFADELGIEDFRGSNGWVRSLRNRKEHQTRNVSLEALEREKVKQDAEAIERMRMVFPNGMTDMAGFFKDLSTFLEKDGSGAGAMSQHSQSGSQQAHQTAVAGFAELEDELKEDDRLAEEFLKKKMIDSLRSWSQELMEAELSRLKKRLKPRQTAIL